MFCREQAFRHFGYHSSKSSIKKSARSASDTVGFIRKPTN
jgi:hypothetical protein